MTKTQQLMTKPQQLVRPLDGRKIAGVAAGIADRFGWSRSKVRLAFVLSIVLPGPQVLAYLAGWILIPSASAVSPIAGRAGNSEHPARPGA